MPTICRFRGIKISINWRDHMPPHFHASYGEDEVIVSIPDIEVLEGSMPSKQLKMLLGWAAYLLLAFALAYKLGGALIL